MFEYIIAFHESKCIVKVKEFDQETEGKCIKEGEIPYYIKYNKGYYLQLESFLNLVEKLWKE